MPQFDIKAGKKAVEEDIEGEDPEVLADVKFLKNFVMKIKRNIDVAGFTVRTYYQTFDDNGND